MKSLTEQIKQAAAFDPAISERSLIGHDGDYYFSYDDWEKAQRLESARIQPLITALCEVVEATEQYAKPETWTVDAIENGFGCDYGKRAKQALSNLTAVLAEMGKGK